MASLVACFHPVPAWSVKRLRDLMDEGRPVPVEFPCGKCIGCQASRQRAWALRITHEAACHKHPSSFVTLTYDREPAPSLNYSDFRDFLRRLKYAYGPTRYFVVGEYGSVNLRPHWHAILFGLVPPQHSLDNLWGFGFTSIGEVNNLTAAYVAKYTCKAVRSRPRFVVDPATGESVRLTPEFARMSLRPGIGAAWFDKYYKDVYEARDGCVLPGGYTVRPPRYYDTRLEKCAPALRDAKRYSRVLAAYSARADSTPARLAVREACAVARFKLKKEQL